MDRDELEWAIEDVKSEREKAIAQVVELTAILKELNKHKIKIMTKKEIEDRIAYLEEEIKRTKVELEECDQDLLFVEDEFNDDLSEEEWHEQSEIVDCIEMDIEQLECNITSFILEIKELKTKL